MLRRLFTLLSVISLLLCVATCVLWVRSYHHWDAISIRGVRGNLWSAGGAIVYEVQLDPPVNPAEEWLFASYPIVDRNSDYWLGDFPAAVPRLGAHLGFGFEEAKPGLFKMRSARAPHWFAFGATALAPATALLLRLNRRGRNHHGLCPTCGYDLRATPGRCPECGTAAPSI